MIPHEIPFSLNWCIKKIWNSRLNKNCRGSLVQKVYLKIFKKSIPFPLRKEQQTNKSAEKAMNVLELYCSVMLFYYLQFYVARLSGPVREDKMLDILTTEIYFEKKNLIHKIASGVFIYNFIFICKCIESCI